MSDPLQPAAATGPAGVPSFDDSVLVEEPPSWPKVIGIISIVWGSLGVTCMGCSLAGVVMQPMFKNMVPPAQQAQMSQPPSSLGGMILMAVSILLGAILIVAGIGTLRRSPMGRTLHLLWAVVGILAIIAGITEFILVSGPAMAQWAKDNSKNPAAAMMGGQWMILTTVGVGALRMAWPVFCLIWFGLIKTKAEQMQGPRDPLASR